MVNVKGVLQSLSQFTAQDGREFRMAILLIEGEVYKVFLDKNFKGSDSPKEQNLVFRIYPNKNLGIGLSLIEAN